MAKCSRCGRKGLFLRLSEGLCANCLPIVIREREEAAEAAKQKEAAELALAQQAYHELCSAYELFQKEWKSSRWEVRYECGKKIQEIATDPSAKLTEMIIQKSRILYRSCEHPVLGSLNAKDPLSSILEKISLNMKQTEFMRKKQEAVLSGIQCQNYIVLDIETTGFSCSQDRIIEIAADEYRDGKLIDQYHTYINPGCPIPRRITQLTGIRDIDVKDSPSIHEVKDPLLSFLRDKHLVGHNIVSFDIPFLEQQLNVSFPNQLHDTLELSRIVFPGLSKYKLSYLDEVLNLGGAEHHRAGNDIKITNTLFLACRNPKEYRQKIENQDNLKATPSKPMLPSASDIHSFKPSDPSIVPNTALTGKCVVFTGDLSIPREQAMQIAVDAGAILKSGVSKKVSYLVDGAHSIQYTIPSKKYLRAVELIEQKACDIQIIDEDTFIKLAEPLP